MNNLKTYGVGVLIVALVVALGVSLSAKNVDVDEIVSKVKQELSLGGTPGFDFLSQEINFNGLKKHYRQQRLNTATSTICSFRSPAATSTLASFQLHINNATATALVLEVARASTAYPTTTRLIVPGDSGLVSLAAQSYNNVVFNPAAAATSSAGGGIVNPSVVFNPNVYINVRVGGAAGDVEFGGNNDVTYQNYSPKGSCEAEFIQL